MDDDSLLAYREMADAGRVPSIQDLLRSGTEFVVEERDKKPPPPGEVKDTFDRAYTPYAWLLVHYLAQGEDGKHRDGLFKWLHFWLSARIPKANEVSWTFTPWRAWFLKCIKVGDIENLEPALKSYAATLKYMRPETHLAIAAKRWKGKKDAEAALANLEEAVRMAPKDGPVLCAAGILCAELPEKGARAAEILRAATAADPLLPEARLALAKLLQGDEAESQRLLGEALRGTPASPTGR